MGTRGRIVCVGRAARARSVCSEQPAAMAGLHKSLIRPVLCLETGEIFPSINSAAHFYGIPKQSISNSLCMGHKARGLTFVDAPRQPCVEAR
eukprot:g72173.t1